MSRWQRGEKRAAEAFGLNRNQRMSYGESGPDLSEHPYLGLEVKTRKKIPKFWTDGLQQAKGYWPDKIPALVVFEKGKHQGTITIRVDDFLRLMEMKGLASKSESDLDGTLTITQDDTGKFKLEIRQ